MDLNAEKCFFESKKHFSVCGCKNYNMSSIILIIFANERSRKLMQCHIRKYLVIYAN